MRREPLAPARQKILFQLKMRGPQTAAAIARKLAVTPMAVRQHLYELEKEGLVTHEDRRKKVGRPARHWASTPKADAAFPDGHADLIVGILKATRDAFGERGIERLVAERTRAQAAAYRARIPAGAPLEKKVAALAAIRREEGYMAEWAREGDGFLLVENHCPICDAARTCQNLCGGEMALFREVLGAGVSVERIEHILEGARRCAYRIRQPGR